MNELTSAGTHNTLQNETVLVALSNFRDGMVGNTVASQLEGPRFDSQLGCPGPLLC